MERAWRIATVGLILYALLGIGHLIFIHPHRSAEPIQLEATTTLP
ncbi:MAG: hypothetical protein AAB472_02730 [Patescibacteria group bacterium]